MLKRQARIIRRGERPPTLNIIPEEDEITSSSSCSPSPMLSYASSSSSNSGHSSGVKARRRHANVSNIRITRDATLRDDNDLSPIDDALLTAPRPAPLPPTATSSPQSSPDSFRLTFTEKSFTFPHPPVPTPSSLDRSECCSPTPSISSISSSPCSLNGGMPLTPSTSDDESIPSRTFHPRRAAIRPLVIHKHHPRPVSPSGEISLSPSLLQPFKNVSEVNVHATLSPLSPSFLESESSESDPESDSEWYTREFSKIISLRSPIPPSFPLQQSCRPDSMSITSDVIVPTTVVNKRRVSKTFQSSVEAAPRRRDSKTRSIPKYPPPPVPPIPAHLRSSVSPPSSPAPAVSQNVRRPPPRSSIPADCVIDLYLDEDEVSNDSSSAFSFTMYEIDLGERELGRDSPASAYSQPSFEEQGQEVSMDNVRFELDYPLMLPLSLPGTPLDLEADIARGLERLHNAEDEAIFEQAEFVIEKEAVQEDIIQQQPLITDVAPVPELQEVVDDVFSPVSSDFTFSPLPSATYIRPGPYCEDERMLKSKWSTSTLGSIREEHERRGTSKLRLYFGGNSLKRTSSSSKKVPATPSTPFGLISPRKASRGQPSPPPAPAVRGHKYGHSRGSSTNSNSDVMVIGYGVNGAGVRRRGSCTTVSDAGSEESSSSSSSSGLRRKPIPIEMFLRNAA